MTMNPTMDKPPRTEPLTRPKMFLLILVMFAFLLLVYCIYDG